MLYAQSMLQQGKCVISVLWANWLTSLTILCKFLKVGLCSGYSNQHSCITRYTCGGHRIGLFNRSPDWSISRTCVRFKNKSLHTNLGKFKCCFFQNINIHLSFSFCLSPSLGPLVSRLLSLSPPSLSPSLSFPVSLSLYVLRTSIGLIPSSGVSPKLYISHKVTP